LHHTPQAATQMTSLSTHASQKMPQVALQIQSEPSSDLRPRPQRCGTLLRHTTWSSSRICWLRHRARSDAAQGSYGARKGPTRSSPQSNLAAAVAIPVVKEAEIQYVRSWHQDRRHGTCPTRIEMQSIRRGRPSDSGTRARA